VDLRRIRVLLADDHRLVAEALAALLKNSYDLVGLVGDGHALVEEAALLKPDVIIADIFMPGLNGIDAARQLKIRGVDSKIIFLTMHVEPALAAEAFRAGASGFISKHSAAEELVQAVQDVMSGRVYVTPLVAKGMIDVLIDAKEHASSVKPELTPRQREVLQLVAEGRTMKQVADVLGISTRTAETHKYEAMEVLGVKTTAELIQWAIRLGLVSIK
jgi:DNA-binding NarL/FixJ family response regulator